MRRLIRWIAPKRAAQQSQTDWWHRVKMVSLATLGLGLISTGGMLYVDRARVISELHQLGAEVGLKLRHIQVRGRSHIEKETLLSALDLQLDTPIFSVDLHALHRRVSDIGWVRNVVVERRLPSTIYIILDERMPVALMQNNATHQLIDATGAIIDGADPRDFTHLKVVAGDNAAANAAPILAALRTEPKLFSEVWAISFRSERRWDVHLKNGMEIRLPETDPISAWSRLAVIDREKAITNRDLAVIDMRLPKQLIVEPNIPVRGQGSPT